MKETYLSRDFRETAAQCFPSQAKELNAFFDVRLNGLLAENADASKEKQYHLRRQILPGIAAYETLQRVMPKEEALQTVHGYVERLPAIGCWDASSDGGENIFEKCGRQQGWRYACLVDPTVRFVVPEKLSLPRDGLVIAETNKPLREIPEGLVLSKL